MMAKDLAAAAEPSRWVTMLANLDQIPWKQLHCACGDRAMNVYTYTEACQNLASLLDQAVEEGEVQIMRRDGHAFVVKSQERNHAPLNIKGIDIKLSLSEILGSIEEVCRSV